MKKRLLLLAVLIALGVAVYGVIWAMLAERVETAAREGLAGLNRGGVVAVVDELSTGGFPFRIALAADGLYIVQPRAVPSWSIGAPRIDVYTHPWTPAHAVGAARGLDAGLGGVSLVAGTARASWQALSDSTRLDSEFGDVVFRGAGKTEEGARAGRIELHVRLPASAPGGGDDGLYAEERADLAIAARDVRLGSWASRAPARSMESFDARLALTGSIAFPATADEIAAWRDAGGTLEIERIAVRWGDVRFDGEGSLALDERMRPMGALTLEVENPRAIFEWLLDQGTIDPSVRPFLPGALAALEQGTRGGPLILPLTLQEGRIFLGPLPIARFGPLFGG